MSLTTRLSVALAAQLTGTHDHAPPSSRLGPEWQLNLASGTGAGQADRLWSDRRTIAASASEDLDLAGSLTDALGATLTLARVKMLAVYALPANTNDVVLGDAAATTWTALLGTDGTLAVKPGGLLVVTAPGATAYPVTAGSADLLKVANSAAGSAVTYDIYIVGASA